MSYVVGILAAILSFGFIVFNHELGHFLTARWAGIRCPQFAIGFGPKLLGFPLGGTDFSLRLSRRGKGGRPSEALWLWGGGAFNQDYNALHAPITIDVPGDVARVELYAVITGHGWGAEAENCAEFCNHTHHFTVNDASFVKEHPEAGTATGCMDRVGEGVVPNQYGTWPFGRGGWCPGFDVRPFLADLTPDAKLGGKNTLTYQALIGTTPPEPDKGYGNVHMSTYLVLWK